MKLLGLDIKFSKQTRGYIIAALIGLLITGVGGKIIDNLSNKLFNANQKIKAQETITTVWKDKYGREVSRTIVVSYTARELRESKDSALRALVASSSELRKLNRTSIITGATFKSEQDFTMKSGKMDKYVMKDSTIIDTIHLMTYSYSDKHFAIHCEGIDTSQMKCNRSNTLNATTNIGWYKDGKWFLPRLFERKKWDALLTTDDTLTTITNNKVLKVGKLKKMDR